MPSEVVSMVTLPDGGHVYLTSDLILLHQGAGGISTGIQFDREGLVKLAMDLGDLLDSSEVPE